MGNNVEIARVINLIYIEHGVVRAWQETWYKFLYCFISGWWRGKTTPARFAQH